MGSTHILPDQVDWFQRAKAIVQEQNPTGPVPRLFRAVGTTVVRVADGELVAEYPTVTAAVQAALDLDLDAELRGERP